MSEGRTRTSAAPHTPPTNFLIQRPTVVLAGSVKIVVAPSPVANVSGVTVPAIRGLS
jgi:hypothetical protein